MKKFNLASAMIKAIKLFEKENKDFDIRNVYAWEWGGNSALFNIEYVDVNGEYNEKQIRITNN